MTASSCQVLLVVPGLVPGIHVDGRDKPGRDPEERAAAVRFPAV